MAFTPQSITIHIRVDVGQIDETLGLLKDKFLIADDDGTYECPVCCGHLYGFVPKGYDACPACNATGRVAIPRSLVEDVPDEADPTDLVACPVCDETGHVSHGGMNIHLCPMCDGIGSVFRSSYEAWIDAEARGK